MADETHPGLPGGLAVVIPAKDEAERIAATVTAALALPGADLVIVVDDGSGDDTAEIARKAGAQVVSHEVNRGKAAAMETGAARAAVLDGTSAPRALLFIDADLEASAAATATIVEPVLAGEADMTIALIPPQATAGGGSGRVVRLSRKGIRQASGWTATQPLSGTRCISRPAFDAALPLAIGWGVETGLTIDVLGAGYRVIEVPCELHHRVTGSDLRGQLHRAGQYRDVWLALLERRTRTVPVANRVFRPASKVVRKVLGG
ncbi:glycosyltransferase family 2 protein [Kineosporia rhizophila]|uniref:glycosyltransferase family 2 protein n=1 Tax=Kineosporia TaxID=49184 RepID=UPI001E46376A|nr:glycosyltransferase family 2 protein [Kineosporia sp. NBRC 101677]MCE0536950.1 glycosyltransferase family 2 protein [Kineosporia rhizophila]